MCRRHARHRPGIYTRYPPGHPAPQICARHALHPGQPPSLQIWRRHGLTDSAEGSRGPAPVGGGFPPAMRSAAHCRPRRFQRHARQSPLHHPSARPVFPCRFPPPSRPRHHPLQRRLGTDRSYLCIRINAEARPDGHSHRPFPHGPRRLPPRRQAPPHLRRPPLQRRRLRPFADHGVAEGTGW